MARINGTNGPDNLFGTSDTDLITGKSGADFIRGDSGSDIIYGDAGNDTIFPDAANDYIAGTYGDDIAYGGTGNDILYTSIGTDTLIGNTGNDTFQDNGSFYADMGADWLHGGKGNDYFMSCGGNDTVIGGADHDYIWFESGVVWADESPLSHLRQSGNDHVTTDTGDSPHSYRDVNLGPGYDTIEVLFSPNNGVATSTVVRDFNSIQDKLLLGMSQSTPIEQWKSWAEMEDIFDTNNNNLLDGGDGYSELGQVYASKTNNSLVVQAYDGDTLTLQGTTWADFLH